MVHIFSTIVKVNSLEFFSKLILVKREKINKNLKDLKFTFHNVCPCDPSTTVNKNNKSFCSKNKF